MSLMLTMSGKKIDFLNPTKEMICQEDILNALPRINRFVGHSTEPYNVGQHTYGCILLAEMMGYSNREKLLVCMHDFAEAYVSDCPTPLKDLLPDFKKIEANIESAIYDHFDVDPPSEDEHLKIKRVDLTMLVLEMKKLTNHDWESFLEDDRVVAKLVTDMHWGIELFFSGLPSGQKVKSELENVLNELLKGGKNVRH